ncbi:cytochrome P450 4F6-like [Bolinopsis microptera]|uniref:cytochrome P450 4F6-like n=1 Tax=Bolinopsis microptera TaxID=2820187 RepID=UPI0030793DFC
MAVTTVLLIFGSALILLVMMWWFSVSGQLYRLKSIPVPSGIEFILGHLNSPGNSLYSSEGADWIQKWGTIYPKLYRIRLGPFNFLGTSHPKYIRALLKEKPEKMWLYRFAIAWLGDGLLFSKGKKWFTRRKMLTPSFHFDLLKSYLDIFNETTNVMVNQFRENGQEPVEIFPKALAMTLDTILRCLVHYETNCQTQYDEYAAIMYRMSLIITDRFFDPMKYPNILFHKTTMGTEYLQLKDKFYEISRKIINDRKDAHLRNPDILKDTKNLSFLDVLLTVKYEDGSNLSMDDILEEANVFIFEGHDTTASGVSFSLFQLSQQPEHMAKCYEEIKEVFDDDSGDQYVTQQQINKLTHFSMCIKEYGLRLPKGTNVAFLIDALHRVEEFWDEPNEFRPERFSPENSKNRDPYSYIPFSVGNRNCIGQNFAITELKMAVAKLIYNFEVVAHQPEKVTRICAMIQKPLNLFLKFIPRESGI